LVDLVEDARLKEFDKLILADRRPKGKTMRYMVVVSRPYLLSFYAKDPKRVAWVLIAAYETSCGGRKNPRI